MKLLFSFKRVALLLYVLLQMQTIGAKSGYCLSFADQLAGTWYPIENLQFEYRSGSKTLWNGGASFKPITGNKKLDKMLKKDAVLIMHNDSLYINCFGLSYKQTAFGYWYAPTCMFDDTEFLFVAMNYKAINKTNNMAAAFGIIGGAIAASTSSHDFMCYVFHPSSETIEAVDRDFMLELLSRHAEQKEEFLKLNKKECHNPLVVLPILRQLGLIKAYPIDEPQE
jgi:hypothetical protein